MAWAMLIIISWQCMWSTPQCVIYCNPQTTSHAKRWLWAQYGVCTINPHVLLCYHTTGNNLGSAFHCEEGLQNLPGWYIVLISCMWRTRKTCELCIAHTMFKKADLARELSNAVATAPDTEKICPTLDFDLHFARFNTQVKTERHPLST